MEVNCGNQILTFLHENGIKGLPNKTVEWNGHPSVTCPVKKTTVIQTPFVEMANSSAVATASTIFASLDGWLTLARVALTGKIYGLRSI